MERDELACTLRGFVWGWWGFSNNYRGQVCSSVGHDLLVSGMFVCVCYNDAFFAKKLGRSARRIEIEKLNKGTSEMKTNKKDWVWNRLFSNARLPVLGEGFPGLWAVGQMSSTLPASSNRHPGTHSAVSPVKPVSLSTFCQRLPSALLIFSLLTCATLWPGRMFTRASLYPQPLGEPASMCNVHIWGALCFQRRYYSMLIISDLVPATGVLSHCLKWVF